MAYLNPNRSSRFDQLVKALAAGIGRQGHDVDLIDASVGLEKTLTAYKYIAVGTLPSGIIEKNISDNLSRFLKSAGMMSGKKSYAFTMAYGLRKNRFMASLMKAMESEGMFIKKSDIIANAREAEVIGSRLLIQDNEKK